jgi:hypothetical protein
LAAGVYVDGDRTFQQVMDDIATSVGAWYAFDGTATLRMGRLTAPSGTAVLALGVDEIGEDVERRPARDKGVPVWSVTINHTKIWSVQGTDLVGSVSAARRAFLADAMRSAVSEDASIKTQYLLATTLEVDTLLTSATDAATEAARILALHKVRRDIFEIPLHLDALGGATLNFMDLISVTLPRFGLTAGKLFRLIGRRLELASSRIILTVWG